jgi:hypothetical protein
MYSIAFGSVHVGERPFGLRSLRQTQNQLASPSRTPLGVQVAFHTTKGGALFQELLVIAPYPLLSVILKEDE